MRGADGSEIDKEFFSHFPEGLRASSAFKAYAGEISDGTFFYLYFCLHLFNVWSSLFIYKSRASPFFAQQEPHASS